MAQTVANLLIKFESDTNNAVRGMNRMEASLQGVGQRTNSVGALLGNFGRVAAGAALVGVTALGAALTATAVDGTKMAMDLESQMSGIAAAMNATRAEVEPLKGLILSLGMNPNLKVSTLEAAAAIDSLVRNGVAMKEIMEGAAEATVLLSNATGGDFAMSADIMTDVMNQFKDSAGSYMDAVNGIAGVTNASKFTIDDYRLAIAQAGGVASSVGVEFGDFNTTIAAISPLFGSGSDAGTSFKTMLQTLIPKSKDAKTAMAELGLIAADGSNAFFDAQGNLKSMADISSILQGALAGLSEEQRNAALSTIFGTDAMRAAVALADSGKVVYTDVALAAKELGVSQEALNGVAKDGITAFEALQVQMGQVDALEAAKTRMDNTKGALEILGGVIETVKIQIGDAFLPVVRQLAEQLTAFVSENQGRIVVFFGSFAAGVAIAAGYIPGLVQGMFRLAEGIGQAMATVQRIWEAVWPVISNVVSTAWTTMQPALDAIKGWVSENGSTALAAVQSAWETAWPAISSTVSTAWTTMQTALDAIKGWVSENGSTALAAVQGAWETAWPAISTAVSTAWTTMQTALDAIKGWVSENGSTALAAVQSAWETAWPAISTAVSTAWTTIQAALDAIHTWLATDGPAALTALQTTWDTTWSAVSTALTPVRDGIVSLVEQFANLDGKNKLLVVGMEAFGAVLITLAGTTGIAGVTAALAALLNPIGLVGAGIMLLGLAWTTNFGGIRDITQQVIGLLQPSLNRLKESVGNMVAGFAELAPKFDTLLVAAQPIIALFQQMGLVFGGAVLLVITTGLNWLAAAFEALPTQIGAVIDQVTATINLITTTVQGVTQTITALFQGDFAGAWAGIQTVVGGVVTYIQQSLGNLGVLVWASFGIITQTLSGTFTDLKAIVSGFGLDVDGAITKLTSLGEWIKKLFTGDVALNFSAPAWIATLLDWMWPDFIVVPDWVTTLLVWSWPLFIVQPGWVLALVAWKWPSFISQPGWVSDLVDWAWPSLGMPAWLERLFNWTWPSFPKRPWWLGGSDETTTEPTTETVTDSSVGRGRSLLGPAAREPALVGASGVNIVINASVANNLDIEDLAYRVAAIIRRRG